MSAEPSVDAATPLISQRLIKSSESSGTRVGFEHTADDASSGAPSAPAVSDILTALNIWLLPPELLTECFFWLDLPDCVRVSCVSTFWRAIALAHPRLWSTIKMNLKAICDVDMLSAILVRTGTRTVEMDLTIGIRDGDTVLNIPFAHAGSLFTILNEVCHRIGSLSIHGMSNHLPLRLLQSSTGGSGRLRTLHVGYFSFADVTAPWTHLVSFRGNILLHDLNEFFPLCPNLIRLELTGDFRNEMQYRNVPLSLAHLILDGDDDIQRYLQLNFSQHPLRSVTVKRKKINIAMALQGFSAAFSVPIHTLNMYRSHFTVYSSDGHRLTMKSSRLGCFDMCLIFWLQPQTLRSQLLGIRYLHLYYLVWGLWNDSVALPVLEELVLEDTRIPDNFACDCALLCIPALRKLSLRYTKFSYVLRSYASASLIPELWTKCIQPVGLRIGALVFGPGPADKGLCNVALDTLGLHRAVEIADNVFVDDELIFCTLSSRGSLLPVPS